MFPRRWHNAFFTTFSVWGVCYGLTPARVLNQWPPPPPLAARAVALTPGLPAHRGGMQIGDTLIRASDRLVRSPADFVAALSLLQAPASLNVIVVRDGIERRLTFVFPVSSSPVQLANPANLANPEKKDE